MRRGLFPNIPNCSSVGTWTLGPAVPRPFPEDNGAAGIRRPKCRGPAGQAPEEDDGEDVEHREQLQVVLEEHTCACGVALGLPLTWHRASPNPGARPSHGRAPAPFGGRLLIPSPRGPHCTRLRTPEHTCGWRCRRRGC
eukprot:scaffold7761_cov417-Prasinococcus_capsulatus_cf.AAC.2